MDYVKAMKIQKRMLGASNTSLCNAECNTCNFHKQQTKKDISCEEFPLEFPELAEKILEKWNEENPPKTRIQVFLEAFPNAPIDDITYTPSACVEDIWKISCCVPNDWYNNNHETSHCPTCWNSPVE